MALYSQLATQIYIQCIKYFNYILILIIVLSSTVMIPIATALAVSNINVISFCIIDTIYNIVDQPLSAFWHR